MLIEFCIENFLSFKGYNKLSMVASNSFKEHKDSHVFTADSLTLLKSVILYGNNASGKSNLLEAIGFMKRIVLNSFRDALLENDDKSFPLKKFFLSTESENIPSLFEVSFIHNDVKYRYGFELDYNRVVSEWLFHTTSKEVYLFKRDLQKIEINKSSFKEAIGKENDIKENVLFISMLATLGKDISSVVVDWFKKINFINGINDMGHKRYTIQKLKSDKDFFSWVLHFVKYLEISNLSTEEEDLSNINLDKVINKEKDQELIDLLNSIQKLQSKQPRQEKLITYHRKYDKDNILIDTVPFDFDRQESEGTKKLIYLLGPWYDTLKNGTILIIDELDSRLHTHLTKRLIDFFHYSNDKNAQLICAVHDTSILNKDTFRRDQIYFIEKNQFGVSELISLSDFKTDKVRNKSAFDKNYLAGKYGAIPYFQANDHLNDF